MDRGAASQDPVYLRLRRDYLIIYLLAAFVDWLQGPYLYTIYSTSNYTKADICSFYMIGFASSGIFGVLVGHFADSFGRKKMCIVYFLSTILTCTCTTSQDRGVLMVGRVFGGVSTSILCSTFESWYVGQHLSRYHLEKDLISTTFAKATFYNGLTAISSGFVSSLLVDTLEYGPATPFVVSIPTSVISGCLCAVLWGENVEITTKSMSQARRAKFKFNVDGDPWSQDIFRGLRIIFSRNSRALIFLGVVQIIFETVMYVFVFLWTPVLEPIDPSFGLVFGIFMMCIGIGSSLHSFFEGHLGVPVETLLSSSVLLGLGSIATCTVGVHLQEEEGFLYFGSYLCLIGFMFFEIAVGMYFPAVGFLRGVVAPESLRASIVNWMRLPCNFLVVAVLFYIRVGGSDNQLMFAGSAVGLGFTALYSFKFARAYEGKDRGERQGCCTLSL
ncbi:molybdate-anion transporter [Diachasma alloeum]|uniref:molybdate-anion transporter n=1 Tax=Diachasma alloeum TaxID=454923 RepID=UPI0010FB76AB|nr:molybdate-anion transporter [Diachasma alloeum]